MTGALFQRAAQPEGVRSGRGHHIEFDVGDEQPARQSRRHRQAGRHHHPGPDDSRQKVIHHQ